MKAKRHKNQPATKEPIQPGKWADYLAGNPEEKEFQLALIAQIREKWAAFSAEVSDMVQRKVSTAEMSRQIGLLVTELEQRLPGKRLTEDFWRQMESLFSIDTGKAISKDELLWCAKVAKHHPDKIKSIQDVQKVQQLVLSAAGFGLESERAPQIAHVPESPVGLLRSMMNRRKLDEVWSALKADENYFQNGRLRPDLCEMFRVEFEPVRDLLNQIWAAIWP